MRDIKWFFKNYIRCVKKGRIFNRALVQLFQIITLNTFTLFLILKTTDELENE